MSIPNLKRIKVSSKQDLRVWLTKQPDQEQKIMLMACNKSSHDKIEDANEDMASRSRWGIAGCKKNPNHKALKTFSYQK